MPYVVYEPISGMFWASSPSIKEVEEADCFGQWSECASDATWFLTSLQALRMAKAIDRAEQKRENDADLEPCFVWSVRDALGYLHRAISGMRDDPLAIQEHQAEIDAINRRHKG